MDAQVKVDWDGAIQELQRRGRCRFDYVNHEQRSCLIGAALTGSGVPLDQVYQGSHTTLATQAAEEVLPFIREQFPERIAPGDVGAWYLVTHFNDMRETTDEDVLLVLEKARANQ